MNGGKASFHSSRPGRKDFNAKTPPKAGVLAALHVKELLDSVWAEHAQ